MTRISALFCMLIGFLVACLPPEPERIIDEVNVDFRDPEQQRLYDFKDRGVADSLYAYFEHRNPTYRFLAARAFGSLRDTAALNQLRRLLRDPVAEVRSAAAFALGQSGDARAEGWLISSFDTARQYFVADAHLMEAVGKVGSARGLEGLIQVSTYQPTDTLLHLGRAYGLYRFGLRGTTAEAGTEVMLNYALDPNFAADVRYVGANYLARAAELTLTDAQVQRIADRVEQEPDRRVRMALASAFGKSKSDGALKTLQRLLSVDNDYRVRVNALRALRTFSYERAWEIARTALRDPNWHVARTAAAFFTARGNYVTGPLFYRWTKDTFPAEVQMELYHAASKHTPGYSGVRGRINYELQFQIEQGKTETDRIAAIDALAAYPPNFRYLINLLETAQEPAVRSAAARGLQTTVEHERFRSFFGANSGLRAREIGDALQRAIVSADAGAAYYAAGALRAPVLKELFANPTFINVAQSRLRLPREIETWNELERTKRELAGETFVPTKPVYNRPIDWNWVEVSYEQPQLVLRTRHGDITFELLPDLAPATVGALAELSEDRFYDGKTFHRVVDNFVVQGGGNRGDGFGALDWTLRSELSMQHYDREGYVGMASAGNDTEGTQFFITHSPTPHLDGDYTIFARVVDGMDVVHKIRTDDQIDVMILK